MGSTATTPGQGVKGGEYTESEDFVEEKPEAMEEMKAEEPNVPSPLGDARRASLVRDEEEK